jgi:hypothetical protein
MGFLKMTLKDKTGKLLSRSEGEAVMKSRGAITISIYAALLAICTLISSSNSSKVLTNNILASDTWAFYQAKSIKQLILELELTTTTDKTLRDTYSNIIKKLEEGRQEQYDKAKKLEAERDEAKKKSPFFSFASALLQIAIVLSTTAILAVSLTMWYASIATGLVGLFLLCNGVWYFLPM